MIKKTLNRLWENFDLAGDIISIIGAAILIIRHYWAEPKSSTSELLVGILGILSILAISGFVEKRNRLTRIESLAKDSKFLLENKVINRIKADEFFQKELSLSEDQFFTANTIYISGITLGKTIRQHTSILSERLQSGAEIKIIILEPEKEPISQLELRSFGKVEDDYYKNRLQSTIDLIKITADIKEAKGSISIGLLPYVPSFGVTLIDPSSKHGVAHVEIYHHNSSESMPAFSLTPTKDPYWFNFFAKQFELMWEKTSKKLIIAEPSKR